MAYEKEKLTLRFLFLNLFERSCNDIKFNLRYSKDYYQHFDTILCEIDLVVTGTNKHANKCYFFIYNNGIYEKGNFVQSDRCNTIC